MQTRTVSDIDFLNNKGFIAEIVTYFQSKFSPSNCTFQNVPASFTHPYTALLLALDGNPQTRGLQSKCTPTTLHCWLENQSTHQERFFPLQKPIRGLQHIWKIWHYGTHFLFSAIAILFQQRAVLSQPYTRKDKFKTNRSKYFPSHTYPSLTHQANLRNVLPPDHDVWKNRVESMELHVRRIPKL